MAPEDLGSVFIAEKLPGAPVSEPIVPPSVTDSTPPQTSSDSGEKSACLPGCLADFSLRCYATELTQSIQQFSLCPGEIFSLSSSYNSFISFYSLDNSGLFFLRPGHPAISPLKLNPTEIFFPSESGHVFEVP